MKFPMFRAGNRMVAVLGAAALALGFTPFLQAGAVNGPSSGQQFFAGGSQMPVRQIAYRGGETGSFAASSDGSSIEISIRDAQTGAQVASGLAGPGTTEILEWDVPEALTARLEPTSFTSSRWPPLRTARSPGPPTETRATTAPLGPKRTRSRVLPTAPKTGLEGPSDETSVPGDRG